MLAFVSSIFPLSDTAPTRLTTAIGASSAIAGIGLFLMRWPVSMTVLRIYTIVGFVSLSVLIAFSTTQLGTAIAAVPYIWFCVFFGAYLGPREARLQTLMMCACFGIALIASDVRSTPSLWAFYTATFIITIEALLASNHALRVRARQDPLTGLLNRRGFEESIEPILALAERADSPVAIVVIDLDEFKEINDSLGHIEGDQMLTRVANSWMGTKRESDLIARWGGDEFIFALPLTSEVEALPMIERFRAADPIKWSYGLVEVRSRDEYTGALRRADRILYDAKEARTG